jgi:hypothetical protein
MQRECIATSSDGGSDAGGGGGGCSSKGIEMHYWSREYKFITLYRH